MLGSDYANTWPGCGEIDIMEHKMNLMLFMVHIIQGFGGNADGNKVTIQLQLNFMYIKQFESTISVFVDDKLFTLKPTITPYHLTKIFS
jgi:hypothetical protein